MYIIDFDKTSHCLVMISAIIGNISVLNIFSVEGRNILSELDEYEAISLVFLVLDQDQLARRAFIICQKISHGRFKVG